MLMIRGTRSDLNVRRCRRIDGESGYGNRGEGASGAALTDAAKRVRPRQHKMETGLVGPDPIEDLMGRQRKQHEQDSILANNPFIEGLFEWMDAPEGAQYMEISDVLSTPLEDVQLDARQRKVIWPDAERLDLDHSIERIRKLHPDFPRDGIEEALINWIDMGYAPESYSESQLDELDRLTERWIADHLRKAKTSKKRKRTRYS